MYKKCFLPGYPKPTRDNESKNYNNEIFWGKKLDVKTIIYCAAISSFNKSDIFFYFNFDINGDVNDAYDILKTYNRMKYVMNWPIFIIVDSWSHYKILYFTSENKL